MKFRTLLALIAVSVCAALGLVACGGDDDASSMPTAAHTTTMSGAMAAASVDSASAADLRVTLDTLLGEHAVLAMVAAQKGYDGADDFEAAAAALDQNAVEISNAIGSVYGDEAARTFLDGPSLWRDHIRFFVDYTVALAEKDKAGQQEAVDNLTGYTGAFSGFLAQATGLPQPALQEGLAMHIMQLKGAIDAYAAGDYDESYAIFREAYKHMQETGDALAAAIVEQHPEMFGS
jgi:hypothetical protein